MRVFKVHIRTILASVLSVLLVIPLWPGSIVIADDPGIILAVDTRIRNQDGLLVLYAGIRLGGDIGLPVGAGDINGDGMADVIFCQMYADAGPGFRRNNGQVSFYISDGTDTGEIDALQDPFRFHTLIGADPGDLLGTSIATGDINGDGIRDVAIGAMGDDGPGNSRFNCGAVYVVWGREDFSMNADLRTLDGNPPEGVTVIYGFRENNRTGIWVDIGDIDGDGYGDIVMGTDQISTPWGQHVGGACVIFGGPDLPPVIDLADLPPGVRMSAILGVSSEDHWGSALHVGDINNDGFADIAIAAAIFRDSASYVTPQDQTSGHDARAASFGGTRQGCGEVYVIYGQSEWPRVIDLRNPPENATHVIGANPRDLLGSQIHSADINGDGKRDLIIGALQALAPDNRGRTGAVYVIYGSDDIEGATVDLAKPDESGLDVTSIYGVNHLDCAGDSVRSFDINGDGKAELFIGSPETQFTLNGELRDGAGDTKIIFGRSELLPPVVKLYDPPPDLPIFRLAGANGRGPGFGARGDQMSYRLAGGDVDGDGFIDYIANAMHGDGFSGLLNNAGQVYIFSGRKLSERLGMMPAEPEPPPLLTSAQLLLNGQPVQQANAGQLGLRVVVEGTGLRADSRVTINLMDVIARPDNPPVGFNRLFVELDETPQLRNSAGPLAVVVRNTAPESEPSNQLIAGRLIGPEITRFRIKRKPNGVLILKIEGSTLPTNGTMQVRTAAGADVPLRSANIKVNKVKAKVAAANAPAPGVTLRVRLIGPTGVQSNEASAVVP